MSTLADSIVRLLRDCGGKSSPGGLAANLRAVNRDYVSPQAVINAAVADPRLRAIYGVQIFIMLAEKSKGIPDRRVSTMQTKINICRTLIRLDKKLRYLDHHKQEGAVHPMATDYADSIKLWEACIQAINKEAQQ